jgi:chemotaxis protein MotB
MALRRNRAEDLENQLNQGALWAVTYGDLMSYMMIFFLILFSFGMSKKKGVAGGDKANKQYQSSLVSIQKIFGGKASSEELQRAEAREKEEKMASNLQEEMARQKMTESATVETGEKKIKLVLGSGILFDSGKAELKPAALEILATVGEQLRTVGNQIVVEGHTDNVPVRGGKYDSNWELAMARAYAVLHFFEKHGVPSTRLAGIGYGENRPIGDNKTPEERAKNRRIEIYLIRTD